jgi:dTDP-4-dehydrorhamnose reductase
VKVWVVGCKGMLGQALARRVDEAGHLPHLTDLECDITDLGGVMNEARAVSPDLIVNCAAYTNVDKAEEEEEKARVLNAEGPRNLAQAAREVGATFIHVSTDYVFDGTATEPYAPDHPVAPLGAYGRTKQKGEAEVMEVFSGSDVPHYVVRTAWLFGRGGGNFVRTMVGLMKDREELTVVNDQRGRPTYAEDLALWIQELGVKSRGSEKPESGFYHGANAGPCTWYEFAEAIADAARGAGAELALQSIAPVKTDAFPRPAPRPAYSVLDTTRLSDALGHSFRPWKEALAEYMPHLLEELRG